MLSPAGVQETIPAAKPGWGDKKYTESESPKSNNKDIIADEDVTPGEPNIGSPALMPGAIKSPVMKSENAPTFEAAIASSPRRSASRKSSISQSIHSVRSSQNKAPVEHVINILPDPDLIDEETDWRPEITTIVETNQQIQTNEPALVTREEYIPVRVARQKVKELCAQMATVKTQHLRAVEKVESHYNLMKNSAENRLREYVKTLATRHEQERTRQAAEHAAKMKRVRAELLGNVDLEVQKAKDQIAALESDQSEQMEIARIKLQHEQTLIEEKRGNAENELEKLKESATLRQREAEASLLHERQHHKELLVDIKTKSHNEVEILKQEITTKLTSEATERERQREDEFSRHMQEAELRFSAKQSELKIEMDSARKEANAASNMIVATKKHREQTNKEKDRYHKEGQESALMSQEDITVIFLSLKKDLDEQIKKLSEELQAGEKLLSDQQVLLAAATSKTSENGEIITNLMAERDEKTNLITTLETQIKKTEDEGIEAAKASVETESELLKKIELIEKMKNQSSLLKQQHDTHTTRITDLEELLSTTRKHNSDVVSQLRDKITAEQKKHQQDKEKAVQLALLSLNGDTSAIKSSKEEASNRLKELIDAAQQQAENIEEQKRHLESELVATTENLQKSEEKRAELQAALLAEPDQSEDSQKISEALRLKDEEVALLKQKIEQHEQSADTKLTLMATNLTTEEESVQQLESKYENQVAPLKADLSSKNEDLQSLRKKATQLEKTLTETDDTTEEHLKISTELEECEEEVNILQSQTRTLVTDIHQLELTHEKNRMQLGITHAENDNIHMEDHTNLVTEISNLATAQEEANMESNKLRAQLYSVSDNDTEEVTKLKQQLADQQEKVATREAASENLQKDMRAIRESKLQQCHTIREKNEAETYLKNLDRVSDVQSGNAAPLVAGVQSAAAASGGDPELQAKYDRDKKNFKQKEDSLKKQLASQQTAMTDLEKAAGNSAGLAKENTALAERTKKLEADVKSQKKKYKELESVAGETAKLKDEVTSLRKSTKESNKRAAECEDLWKTETALRKKYFNEIQDLKGKIRVMVRCRPMNSIEKKKESKTVVAFPDEYSMIIPVKKKEFLFDHVFSTESTQDQVWNESKHFVQSAIDGYNTCIFAYGQTGSGKTFTMEGSTEHPGLTPRCINELYETLESQTGRVSFSISCYMLELYTDNLYDLLLDKKQKKNAPHLDIKKDPKGMIMVSGATICPAEKREDLAMLYMEGCKSRHVRSTGMNATSSRSHLVFGILIETQQKSTGKVANGKMSLVDLAGSERMEKTGIKDDAGQAEAKSINKSLTALGDVIAALSSDPSGFIPYRNNKLTLLMSDSLGGNAKTMMIAAVSPASYNVDESVNTLNVCFFLLFSFSLVDCSEKDESLFISNHNTNSTHLVRR